MPRGRVKCPGGLLPGRNSLFMNAPGNKDRRRYAGREPKFGQMGTHCAPLVPACAGMTLRILLAGPTVRQHMRNAMTDVQTEFSGNKKGGEAALLVSSHKAHLFQYTVTFFLFGVDCVDVLLMLAFWTPGLAAGGATAAGGSVLATAGVGASVLAKAVG